MTAGASAGIGRRAVRGAAWTLPASLFSRTIGLAGTLLLARFLAPDDYGAAMAAVIVATTASSATTMGMGIYLVANRGISRAERFHATCWFLGIGIAVLSATLLLALPLERWTGARGLAGFLPVAVLAALVERVYYVPERLLVASLRFRRLSAAVTAGELTFTAVTLACAAQGAGAISIAWGGLARAAVRFLAIVPAVAPREWLEPHRLRPATFRAVAGYGLQAGLASVVAFGMRRWDNLLISRFFGAAPMGAYNYAYNLADTPGTAIGEQLNDIIGASFPHVDRDRRPEALVRCCTVLSIVMLPMTVGLAAVAPTVVETFFDPNWSSVAPMLMVLASLSLTRPIAGVVAGYFYASGRPRIVLALECLSLAGLMAALSTLGRASLARACVCVAAVFALRALAGVWLVRRHDQVPMSAFFVPLAKPSAVCAVMAAGVAGVQLACSGLAPPLRLLLAVSAGAAIYASGLRAVARPRYEELMSVLRQAIARGEIDPAPRPLPDRPAVRVLSLSSEFPNPSEPGKGLFVRARLAALASRAHVTVVAPVALLDYANPHGELLGARRIPGERREGSMRVLHPRWVYPPLGGWLNAFFLFAWLLPTVARRCRTVDVIDAHFAHPEGIAAVLLGKVVNRPVVVTVRGSELRYYRQRSKRFWMSWALRRADRVVAVSENLRRLALDLGVDGQRVRTVPNGIHAGTFYPRDRAAARARFDIRPAEAVILSAGDLAELKGHHRVIAAMRDLSARGVRARLLIAGGIGRSGRYAATLRRQVHDDGLSECVTFVGELSQEDLGVLMSAADVFCLASSTEGWPNVVNEALACGTPVVATDVGAVREMVESDGHGYVVPVGDQSALSDALHTALTRAWDREAIAARGRSRSWSQVAGDVLEIMQAVVDARATAPGNGNADERLRQRARLSRSPRIGRA